MLSMPLLKYDLKNNYKLWLIFAGVLTIYSLLITGMYDPDMNTKLGAIMESLPKELLLAMGFDMDASTLTGFLSSYLFGFLFLILPLIYEILVASRLVVKLVDDKTMTYFLVTPNKRKKIIFTQAYYLAASLFLMFFYTAVLGILCSSLWFPGELDITAYLLLNVGAFCLHLCLSGICFLASAVCDETGVYLMIGGGLPVVFYLVWMLSNMGGFLENFKYATVFTLFDPKLILEGDQNILWMLPMLALVGILLYQGALEIFKKRDLPL